MPITIGVISISAGVLAHFLRTGYNQYVKPTLNSWNTSSIFENTVELRVLGFPNSGKTQFLNALRNINNPYQKKQTIAVEDLPNFIFYNNDIKWNIHAKDINGSKEFLVEHTQNFSKEANYLLFLFNGVSYLRDDDGCRIEIERVLRAISEYVPISPTHGKVAIIMTYSDRLGDIAYTPKTAIDKFKRLIADRKYCYYPCYTVNTNDQNEVRQLFKRILNEQ